MYKINLETKIMGLFKDLFGSGTPLPQKPAGPTGIGANNQNKPKDINLRGGVYNDPSRFDSNFRHQVRQDLAGTLKRSDARHEVADILHDSRGGGGIKKGEVKRKLEESLKAGKLNKFEVRAIRKKFGIF
jgi:hypothetical protein